MDEIRDADSSDNPATCPIHNRELVCPSCRASAAAKAGAGSPRRKAASRANAKKPRRARKKIT